MLNAYPTFKLYFVEEDEYESRYINLDDFYSLMELKVLQLQEVEKMQLM